MKSAPQEPLTGEKAQLLDAGASQEEMRGNASQHDECTPPSVSNTVAWGSNKRPHTENGAGRSPLLPRGLKGRHADARRDSRPPALRAGVNEVGLLLRTVDPSLLTDPLLSGDTSLSLAQVAQYMNELASSRHPHGPDNTITWHTDWFSTAALGFPLVDDQFHRDVHPLIRRYVLSLIHTGDQSVIPILRF
jgi:hypothetical protein